MVYAVISQTPAQADPARLGAQLRAHWQIEGLHHIRDVTFSEDASRIHAASGPQVMATSRNLAVRAAAPGPSSASVRWYGG